VEESDILDKFGQNDPIGLFKNGAKGKPVGNFGKIMLRNGAFCRREEYQMGNRVARISLDLRLSPNSGGL